MQLADVEDSLHVGSGAAWFRLDASTSGQGWKMEGPVDASWFLYDKKMKCVATSLEKNRRNVVIPPEDR